MPSWGVVTWLATHKQDGWKMTNEALLIGVHINWRYSVGHNEERTRGHGDKIKTPFKVELVEIRLTRGWDATKLRANKDEQSHPWARAGSRST